MTSFTGNHRLHLFQFSLWKLENCCVKNVDASKESVFHFIFFSCPVCLDCLKMFSVPAQWKHFECKQTFNQIVLYFRHFFPFFLRLYWFLFWITLYHMLPSFENMGWVNLKGSRFIRRRIWKKESFWLDKIIKFRIVKTNGLSGFNSHLSQMGGYPLSGFGWIWPVFSGFRNFSKYSFVLFYNWRVCSLYSMNVGL